MQEKRDYRGRRHGSIRWQTSLAGDGEEDLIDIEELVPEDFLGGGPATHEEVARGEPAG